MRTVVATSERKADDIVARSASRAGADVFRGSESDVLGRIYDAARSDDTDMSVRVTGDCPLIDSETIDTIIQEVTHDDAQYAANIFERTFPRGSRGRGVQFRELRTSTRGSDEAPPP